jgi:predicted nucleic acid-binding protein
VFIRGLRDDTSDAAQLLNLISENRPLVIPRLVAQEVTRNLLNPEQAAAFYHLFARSDFAFIVEEPVPRDLVLAYTERGLPAKADAFIGAFAEWLQVDYLISDNRHFLRDLQTTAYQVITPAQMLQIWEQES